MDEIQPEAVPETVPEPAADSAAKPVPEPAAESAPEPVPPPAPEPDPRVDKLLQKVSLLEQLFVKRIKDDQVHAAAYQSLYQEMVTYRDDALRNYQKPLLKGLILLYDTMTRSLHGLGEGPEREAVQLHVEELLEVLHRQEVEIMTERPEVFDPKLQKAVSSEPADDPGEDKQVVRVVREGFRWGTRVLRPQEVIVKVHTTT